MKSRIALLVLIMAVIGGLAFFNFPYLAQDVPMSVGFTTVDAPLGLILLALTGLMAVVFMVYVVAMQGAWLLEARAHAKAMSAQRELADKAEASRFTELRVAMETLHQEKERRLLERMDALEAHLQTHAQDSENAMAAYVGALEQQLRAHNLLAAAHAQEPGDDRAT